MQGAGRPHCARGTRIAPPRDRGRGHGRRRGRRPASRRAAGPPTHPSTLPSPSQDPEGILAAPQGGHINRREVNRAMEANKELAAQVEEERKKAREELLAARAGREPPAAGGAALVDYFMETEADEMEFELARARPLLTADFFSFLDSEIGALRFAARPNPDKLAELEVLRDMLKEGAEALDANAEALKAPAERMRRLLTAPDKRATLLAMAEANEVDAALVNLLQQNADAARAAGNADAAKFLEKVRDAARKFVITI